MKLKAKLTKDEIIIQLKNLALVIFGTLVLAFGCAVFVVPFELVTGGVTGLAIVIDHAFGSLIPIDYLIGIITWGLFFLGLFFLGTDFAIKTLASTIIYPIAISLFLKLVDPSVMNGVLYLQGSAHADIALIISALFGGLCIGTGCALTFMGGGSTGGVDIIAFILCKYFKKWKSSTVIFIVDATAVVLGLFVIQEKKLSEYFTLNFNYIAVRTERMINISTFFQKTVIKQFRVIHKNLSDINQ